MPSKKKIMNNLFDSLKANKFFATPLHIIILIIYVVLIVYTLIYLNDLEKCECFNEKEYKTNILFLKIFEGLVLVGICVTGYFIFKLKMQKGGGKNPLIGILIGMVITVLFHFFVVLNIWGLYKNVNEDCKCSDKWEQYFLYYQGISSSFILASNVISFLLLLIGGFVTTVGAVKKLK
jgi:hypothetical protein